MMYNLFATEGEKNQHTLPSTFRLISSAFTSTLSRSTVAVFGRGENSDLFHVVAMLFLF